MNSRKSKIVFIALLALVSIVLFSIALGSCFPDTEVDPDATPIAVMDVTIPGFDLTLQAAGVVRAATISAYQTQSAGLPPVTYIPFAESVGVLVNANCHAGPGMEYGVALSLFAGETVALLGVDDTGTWFYIEALGAIRCWILSTLVSLPGGFIPSPPPGSTGLPVIPPPPTPLSTLTPSPFPTPPPNGTPGS